jgi:hypothetical protein
VKFTLLLAVTALLATADDPNDRIPRPSGSSLSTHEGPSLLSRPLETLAAEVRLGDQAPNFSYQGVDGRWRHLRDMLVQGPVLLVFGADPLTLRVIEHERERLLDLGVVPVAVTDAALALGPRDGESLRPAIHRAGRRAGSHRLSVHCRGSVDRAPAADLVRGGPGASRARTGTGGLPRYGYPTLAANALGLPASVAPLPASR